MNEPLLVNTEKLSQLIGQPEYTIRKLRREKVYPAYSPTGKPPYFFDPIEIKSIIKKNKVD